MAKKSIGDLHATVTANAQQFVSEFNRADNAAKRSAVAIDKEVDKLSKSLAKKFSLSDIGKGLAQGLGIGSGLALAQNAADFIAGAYERAAKAAEQIAEYTERSAKATLGMISDRQSPEQQLAVMVKQMAELEKLKRDAAAPIDMTSFGMPELPADSPVFDEQRVKVAALTAQMNELGRAMQNLGDKVNGDKVQKALYAFFDPLDMQSAALAEKSKIDAKAAEEAAKRITEATEWKAAAQRGHNAELEKEAKIITEKMMTPLERYSASVAHLNQLYAQGKIDFQTFSRAVVEEGKTLENALEPAKKGASEFQQSMALMWNSVSDRAGQAFADMVLEGSAKFSDLTDMIARSIIEMTARLAIINPILNAIFGASMGGVPLPAFFGAGKTPAATNSATGGAVTAGQMLMTGETGPELFVPQSNGKIISNADMKKGGGTVFNFVNNIAAGVSRAELIPALEANRRATMAEIRDLQRRGAYGF